MIVNAGIFDEGILFRIRWMHYEGIDINLRLRNERERVMIILPLIIITVPQSIETHSPQLETGLLLVITWAKTTLRITTPDIVHFLSHLVHSDLLVIKIDSPSNNIHHHFPITATQFRRNHISLAPLPSVKVLTILANVHISHHHSDLCNDFHGNPSRYIMDDIPMTRMTRLKQPGRTYWRDDGMKTNVGIGLGKVLGMAASRSLRREAKRDIGVGTHKAPPRSTQKESKVLSLKCILI